MAPQHTVRLVYRGGADLTFHDGTGQRRKVLHGEPFDVDRATADILRATDDVESPDEAAGRDEAEATGKEPRVADLRARAAELDLEVSARATKAQLQELIAEAEARLAAKASVEASPAVAAPAAGAGGDDQGGDSTPASDPDATAAGEAGTPPETEAGASTGGAIVLGDLPAAAKIGGARETTP